MESEDRNNRFSFIIGNMYNLLRQLEPKCNCNNIYRSTSETIFDKSRKIFDYEYNIKALQKRDNCSDYSDGQKYDLHREEAQKEYEWLCENCGVGDAGYCEKIKGKNRECKNKGPVELECPRKKPSSGDDFDNDSAAQQDDEPEELDDPEGILGSTHLDRVKSKLKQYEELSGGSGGCGNDSGNILQSVKSTLQSNIGVDNNAEKILGAWCYTYEKKNGSNPINEYCDYLYYWIGDTLLNGSLSVRNLKDLMSDLFPKLNSWKSIKGCDKIETTADESEFNRRKQVFEYLQQCKIMKAQLKGNSKTPPTQKPKCTQAYDTYLKEVVNALKSEYTKCSGPDRKRSVSDSYCTNFLAMCQQCNPEQLSQLKCEVPKTEESIASNYQASSTEDTITSPSENSSSITPTTVISSIVPIIGLPLTALLLYKYTSAFDWVKKSSSRSRRKKRSITRQRIGTSLTDNDTSSTLYSRETGSIEEEASTLGNDSTDEVSTLYGGPPPPTGRSNNRREKQHPPHSQQGQQQSQHRQQQRQSSIGRQTSRNISYGRM